MRTGIGYTLGVAYIVGAGVAVIVVVQAVCGLVRWLA